MKIDIQIDDRYKEETVIIKSSRISDELKQIINYLNKILSNNKIYGKLNDKTYLIDPKNIINIFIENKSVTIKLKNNEKLISDLKLYQLEEKLDLSFVRISKSEIININYLKFDGNGMIQINFKDGSYTYSSRNYLKNLKERLKL